MKRLITLFLLCTSIVFAQEIPLRKHDRFAICAIPKCGTYFIQHTITLLTGKSIGNSGELYIKNALYAAEKANAILRIWSPYNRKSHLFIHSAGYKFVGMIRDPRDALISLLFYMRRFEGRPRGRDFFFVEENFDHLSLDEQIHSLMRPKTSATSYLDFYKERTGWYYPPYFLTVKYEDLVGAAGGGDATTQAQTLFRIIDYINLKISHEEVEEILPELYRASPHTITVEDKTFYPAIIGNWKTFLNESHKKVFKETLGQVLIDLGYEEDFEW